MLEYCQTESRYLERPAGSFQPNMIRLWDDLFALCEKHRLRILLTPFDTFWMWIRWKKHPYNKINGGPCTKRTEWLLCSETLQHIKNRLTFATTRWGGSGVLFAWDLWNEIHPAHARNSTEGFNEFIGEISTHLREVEMKLYGRTHLQTVSLFSPVLKEHPAFADVIFRHPKLDFATIHFYDRATINHPKDTVSPAVCTGELIKESLEHLPQNRPFFDSEHGPIHAFKDRHRTLPEPFDDEYFKHIQWAHLASGGAGGGMRWPNRNPHVLTAGMRRTQYNLSNFVQLINWKSFYRQNLNNVVRCSTNALSVVACGDKKQAIIWLLRNEMLYKKGMVAEMVESLTIFINIPGMDKGNYKVVFWDTEIGELDRKIIENRNSNELLLEIPSVKKDIAIAIIKNGEE